MNPNNGRRNWRNTIFSSFLSILVATLLASTSCSRTPNQTTWQYSEFIQAVEQNKVESISIKSDRSQATFTTQDGETVLVNLPNEPMLIEILEENNVDISVIPADENGRINVLSGLLVVSWLSSLFWVWVLIDCATKEPRQGNTKIAWLLIILFANFVGALIYFLVRRPQRRREFGE